LDDKPVPDGGYISRMSVRRFRTAALAALGALALAACGSSQANQVRAKVQQFGTAVRSHDYRTICTQVLAPQLLGDIAAGGVSCEEAMKLGLGSVSGARLVLSNVRVSGSTATVLTATQAKGERTTLATLHLTETRAGWRIVSLGAGGSAG
jgi:hypothetical protein